MDNVTPAPAMTFEAFATLYRATFATMLTYALNQVGSDIYCAKLADLADAFPDWADLVENEGGR